MNLIDKLKSKNIKVTEIPKWGPYLRKEWENQFAQHLSTEERKKIYLHDQNGMCGYLWHLFSFQKKDCVEREHAEEAFNNELKKECFIFFHHSDEALLLENATTLNTEDLASEIGTDLYITDKQFNWTYVITHETDWCGPYFARK
ncbi:hypothetical protein UACE39S_03136 [Ureibacillus acetophenoni]